MVPLSQSDTSDALCSVAVQFQGLTGQIPTGKEIWVYLMCNWLYSHMNISSGAEEVKQLAPNPFFHESQYNSSGQAPRNNPASLLSPPHPLWGASSLMLELPCFFH